MNIQTERLTFEEALRALVENYQFLGADGESMICLFVKKRLSGTVNLIESAWRLLVSH